MLGAYETRFLSLSLQTLDSNNNFLYFTQTAIACYNQLAIASHTVLHLSSKKKFPFYTICCFTTFHFMENFQKTKMNARIVMEKKNSITPISLNNIAHDSLHFYGNLSEKGWFWKNIDICYLRFRIPNSNHTSLSTPKSLGALYVFLRPL